MSIFNTLQTAVSGMSAQASKLATIGDNIANSSTTGYKDADTQFETVLGSSSTTSYDSGSVQTNVRYGVSQQGEIDPTSSTTDLAIQGDGFFVVQTSGSGTALTRAGSFVPDSSGDLINAAGFKLMGYSLTDGSYSASTGVGTLKPVNISSAGLSASPSAAGTLAVNLNSAATAVAAADLPAANAAAATATSQTSLVAYDKLGTAVNLDVYMTKTGSNTWEVAAYNAADRASGGTFPYSAGGLLGTQTLSFDSTGKVSSGGTLSVAVPGGNTVAIDMSNSTQLASAYNLATGTVDGNAPSKVSSITIGNDGTVSTVYDDGVTSANYRIPLANVQSPDQMTVLTGNIYEPNLDSGAMTLGTANAGSLGKIDSSSLENSTVDLATELTSMISTQRAYEANSKVLTTGSDMLSTIIQAIHQ